MFVNNDKYKKVFKYLSIFRTATKDNICKVCAVSAEEFDDMIEKEFLYPAKINTFFSLRPDIKVNMNSFHLSWVSFFLKCEDFPIYNSSPDNITFVSSDRAAAVNAVYADKVNCKMVKEYIKQIDLPIVIVSTERDVLDLFVSSDNLKKMLLTYNDIFSEPTVEVL